MTEDIYEKHAAEFKNEDDIEEELDEAVVNTEKAEREHFDLEKSAASEPAREMMVGDEDRYIELTSKGISSGKAANIVNSETAKEIKEKEFRRSKFGKAAKEKK